MTPTARASLAVAGSGGGIEVEAFSLLDLSPIPEGQTARAAIENTVSLGQAAESAGYHRYWLAEHHNMPGIASAAPSRPPEKLTEFAIPRSFIGNHDVNAFAIVG